MGTTNHDLTSRPVDELSHVAVRPADGPAGQDLATIVGESVVRNVVRPEHQEFNGQYEYREASGMLEVTFAASRWP